MLDVTLKSSANEITLSAPPLAPESKESATQEKKAAPEGENEPSIAELAEALWKNKIHDTRDLLIRIRRRRKAQGDAKYDGYHH